MEFEGTAHLTFSKRDIPEVFHCRIHYGVCLLFISLLWEISSLHINIYFSSAKHFTLFSVEKNYLPSMGTENFRWADRRASRSISNFKSHFNYKYLFLILAANRRKHEWRRKKYFSHIFHFIFYFLFSRWYLT